MSMGTEAEVARIAEENRKWNEEHYSCPSCWTANKLWSLKNGKFGCSSCHVPKQNFNNVNLGQTVDSYTKRDGTKGRITTGKAWEIDSRTISPEGVVVNKHTGREAQY